MDYKRDLSSLKPFKVSRPAAEEELREAWGEWLLTMPWDYFLTVTFREPLPPHRQEGVLHSLEATVKRVFKPVGLFLGTEPHISRNVHIHGLVRSAALPAFQGVERQDMWRYLFDKFGRSQVLPVRGTGKGAAYYVTKYCTKGNSAYSIY